MQVYKLNAEGIAFRFLPDPQQVVNALQVIHLTSIDFNLYKLTSLHVCRDFEYLCWTFFHSEKLTAKGTC